MSGGLQDAWLDGFETQIDDCYFSPTLNGRTSDELGFKWLNTESQPATVDEAKRRWRMLFVDGRGSCLT